MTREDAYAEAVRRWGQPVSVKAVYGNLNIWYHVGFVDTAGRGRVMGTGLSWEDALADAAKRAMTQERAIARAKEIWGIGGDAWQSTQEGVLVVGFRDEHGQQSEYGWGGTYEGAFEDAARR